MFLQIRPKGVETAMETVTYCTLPQCVYYTHSSPCQHCCKKRENFGVDRASGVSRNEWGDEPLTISGLSFFIGTSKDLSGTRQ